MQTQYEVGQKVYDLWVSNIQIQIEMGIGIAIEFDFDLDFDELS